MEVTAHRGGARIAPENTISAMEAAVNALADYAEIGRAGDQRRGDRAPFMIRIFPG